MGRRSERLAEAIREEVAQVFYELEDPRLGLVTVTRVELSADLGHARIGVGVVGDEAERKKSLAALRSAAGYVRREIGRRLRIRQVPEIDFRYDKGEGAVDRVERLLEEDRLAVEAMRPDAGAAPDGLPVRDPAGDEGEDEER